MPVVVHEHVISPQIPFVQRVADRLLNHRVDRVVAVSEGVAKNCVRSRRFPQDRVQTILNGIPLEKEFPIPSKTSSQLKLELEIPDGSIVVGFVGRLDEQKDPRSLIKAFALVKRDRPDAVLVLVGDGPLVNELRQLSSSLGVAEAVKFLGYRKDVRELQSFFTVQAMPSRWEGLGLVALEALASGVPLVASDIPGMDELLENEKNSLLGPPDDPVALAGAILRLLENQELMTLLASNGRETVKKFDIAKNVNDLVQLYRKLVPQP
jgi:glycosyltransferase involved in cell wall biosynthesis